jgi:hypothetical protein
VAELLAELLFWAREGDLGACAEEGTAGAAAERGGVGVLTTCMMMEMTTMVVAAAARNITMESEAMYQCWNIRWVDWKLPNSSERLSLPRPESISRL